MRFFAAAPGVELPTTTIERFGFSIPIRVERGIDLTLPRLDRGRELSTRD
jgi:hypothetical protein